jgi:hypothetical protein
VTANNIGVIFMIIEFLGPSGVGKTTLLNSLVPDLSKEWRINYAYLAVSEPWSETDDLKTTYRILLEKKVKNLIRTQNFFDIPHLLNHYSTRTQRDFWMVCGGNRANEGFINDEGLVHLFLEELYELITENEATPASLRQIFENRILFSFFQDKDKIISNLRQRSLEIPGAIQDQVGRHGVESTMKQIDSYYSHSIKLIDKIRDLGGCVVELNLECPIDLILDEIKSYLNVTSNKLT